MARARVAINTEGEMVIEEMTAIVLMPTLLTPTASGKPVISGMTGLLQGVAPLHLNLRTKICRRRREILRKCLNLPQLLAPRMPLVGEGRDERHPI